MANILIITPNLEFTAKLSSILEPQHTLSKYTEISQIYTQYKIYALVIIDCCLISEGMAELEQLGQFNSKILLAGSRFSEENQIKAVITGVSGYCETDIHPDLLDKAIKSILAGDIWIQRHLFPRVLFPLVESNQSTILQKKNTEADLQSLSARELDVAKMISHGKSNKLIASTLFISERTVKAHLTSIFKKLGVRDRLHLAVYLSENNNVNSQKESIHE
jgi:two-component system nitrate/nitrite response regulator NarL